MDERTRETLVSRGGGDFTAAAGDSHGFWAPQGRIGDIPVIQMSGPAASAQWYLARDGEQFGPISDAEMARFVELGHLKPTDLLWREGFPDWRPAMLVFPPHARPLPADPRTARGDPRQQATRSRMVAEPFAGPAPHDRAGYEVEPERRRPRVLAHIARLLLTVAVLAAAAGAAYVYRVQLTAFVASLTEPSGPPVADRRSLELPPLAGFRAGNAEAVDAALQSTALWKVIKREFSDWYDQRIAEAVQLAQEGKDEAVVGQLMARKLADLRRHHAGTGLFASPDRLKTMAVTYFDSVKRLRAHNVEACAGFVRRGEAEPLVAALLQQPTDQTAHLQTQLTAVFEAIAEGRQALPRVPVRPTPEHQKMLEAELLKRGWTGEDFNTLFGSPGLAQAPAEKACQLVYDFFGAQLALPDPEAQMRLLINSLRPVFTAG
jgi:hypothetical protein